MPVPVLECRNSQRLRITLQLFFLWKVADRGYTLKAFVVKKQSVIL